MENYNISSNITRASQNLTTKKINDFSNMMMSAEFGDVANIDKTTEVSNQSIDINEKNSNSYKDLLRKILESAKDFPELLEAIKKILINDQFIDINIRPNDVLSALLEQFMQLIQMDKVDILDFIKFQIENYSKFSGDFFEILKYLLKENSSFQIKELISNFLKNYDCFLTSKETMSATSNILNRIQENLPANLQQPFAEMVEKLNTYSLVPEKIIIEKNSSNIFYDILKTLPVECKKEIAPLFESIEMPVNSTILNDEILPILEKYIFDSDELTKIKDQLNDLTSNKYSENDVSDTTSVKEKDVDAKIPIVKLDIENVDDENVALQISSKSDLKYTKYMEGIDFNVSVLKNEIIPFLLNADSNNVKDLVSLLIHNVLRLDTGTKENFDLSVNSLFEYLKKDMKFDDEKIIDLRALLHNNIVKLSNLKNPPLDYLLKLANEGLKESNSNGCKIAFKNLLQAMLVNNDIKVPFMHLFIPLSYKNRFMFSEIWIGKTTEYNVDKKSTKDDDVSAESDSASILLITVDIDKFGYFELVILFDNNQIDIDIYVPKDLANYSEMIKSNIDDIIKSNNIDLRRISISICNERKKLCDVFPKSEFKNNNINVRV